MSGPWGSRHLIQGRYDNEVLRYARRVPIRQEKSRNPHEPRFWPENETKRVDSKSSESRAESKGEVGHHQCGECAPVTSHQNGDFQTPRWRVAPRVSFDDRAQATPDTRLFCRVPRISTNRRRPACVLRSPDTLQSACQKCTFRRCPVCDAMAVAKACRRCARQSSQWANLPVGPRANARDRRKETIFRSRREVTATRSMSAAVSQRPQHNTDLAERNCRVKSSPRPEPGRPDLTNLAAHVPAIQAGHLCEHDIRTRSVAFPYS